MKTIYTDKAPVPAGHYSQAIVSGGLVYVSGQLPIDPGTGEKLGDRPVEEQTRRALDNLEAVLLAAGSSREKVLKITVYVSDISLWDLVNREYAAFFGEHKPARSVVPTRDLHFGLKVEVDAIAVSSGQ